MLHIGKSTSLCEDKTKKTKNVDQFFFSAAKCYEDGLGCLKNKSKAVQYYKYVAGNMMIFDFLFLTRNFFFLT